MDQLEYGDTINQEIKEEAPLRKFIKIVKKVTTVLLGLLAGYVVIGFILMLINPMFAWIVLYPVFAVQDFIAEIRTHNVERNLSNLEVSEIVLSEKLFAPDCIGFLGDQGFLNNNHPRIKPFAERLDSGRFTSFVHCDLDDYEIVFEKIGTASSYVTNAYLVEGETLTKFFTLDDILFGVLEDSDRNIFITLPSDKSEGIFLTKDFYQFDREEKKLLSVTKFSTNKIEVCESADGGQCRFLALEKSAFPEVQKLNTEIQEKMREEAMREEMNTETEEDMIQRIEDTSAYIQSHTYDMSRFGLGADISGNAFVSVALFPDNKFSLVKIAIEEGVPPWRIYFGILDITTEGKPSVITILDPLEEMRADLVSDGKGTNSHYNGMIKSVGNDTSFTIKFYDSDTKIEFGTYGTEYTYTYKIVNGDEVIKQ